MEWTTDQVMDILERVADPKSGQPITKMRMVDDLTVDGKNIRFTLRLTPGHAQHKSDLNFLCQNLLQEHFPGAEVHIHVIQIGGDVPTPDVNPLSQIKNIIAVASGKGGVGKSTVAVNLALGLKAIGAKVGLLDADVYGPSLPTMLHLQGQRPRVEELYGSPRIIPLEAYGVPVISIGNVVDPEQAVVLRGPRLAGIIKQFFLECNWPELDYLIVDLPPGTGDVQLTLVQTVPVTGAIMVTTPQDVALADAIKAMNMFLLPNVNVPILGVVENMSWFTPAELPENKYYLFGQGGGQKLAAKSESVLLGQLPLIQSIRESGDSGKPAVLDEDSPARPYFLKIAEETAKQVVLRNEKVQPTNRVQIST
ncbi:MAG: Mrp/NBP35 family ATP-binding protein [Saprospiraceae bacterium]|nr:Mrp/NBP35 family ATP-binding protein [Saprospiraceae bacterium]